MKLFKLANYFFLVLLSGLKDTDLPEDVALYELNVRRLCADLRRWFKASFKG